MQACRSLTFYLPHAELSKQVADGVVDGKPLDPQQRMQRLVAPQQGGVREAFRAYPVPCRFDAKPIAALLRAGDKIGLARNGGFEQHCGGNTCIERIVRSEGHKNDSAPRE
jgi:hypothetical protein